MPGKQPRKPQPQPTMDPEARKPASLASFRPDDQTAALLLQLLMGGLQPAQAQPEPVPLAPAEADPQGLHSLLQMLMTR